MTQPSPALSTNLRDLIGILDAQIDRPEDEMIRAILTVVFGHAALSTRGSNTAPALLHAIEKDCGALPRDIRDWAYNGLPVPAEKQLSLLAVLKRFARHLTEESQQRVRRDRGRYSATPSVA
jgi:hypothetical protein